LNFRNSILVPRYRYWTGEVPSYSLKLTTPYSYRKVGTRSTLRELIIPFGTTGYIVRFDIRSPGLVLVFGVRHQREEDFH
jgi:hypothetical protein